MRLLKAQNTNLRNIYGKGVKYDIDDQVIMDSTNSVLVPKGTTAQRPTNAATENGGHFRYNTTLDGSGNEIGFEVYYDGSWRRVRFKEPNANPGIVVQTTGFGSIAMEGDANEVYFGPLDSQDPDYPVPTAAQHILVFVENVYQLPTTNYVLEQNPARTNTIASIVSTGTTTVIQTATNHTYSTDDLIYIEGVECDPDDNIENLNNGDSSSPVSFNIASIPAANQIEVEVDTSGGNIANYIASSGICKRASSIDGQYYPDGWYIKFTSAVDLGKPVTVLHNFDK